MDSEYVLRIELTEFTDRSDVGFVRKKEESRKNLRFLTGATGRIEVAID